MKKATLCFSYMLLLSLILQGLLACTAAYDKYMQEGREFEKSNQLDNAQKAFHKAAQEAKKQKDGKEKQLEALNAEADAASRNKESKKALEVLDQIAEINKANKAAAAAAATRLKMGRSCLLSGNGQAAKDYFQTGIDELNEAGLESSKEMSELLAAMAELEIDRANFKAAAALLQKSWQILESDSQSDAHQGAAVLNRLAYIYQQLNMDNEAIELTEAAKKLELGGMRVKIHKLPKI